MWKFRRTDRSDTSNSAYATARLQMVEHQLRRRGIVDDRLLKAFETVERHRFGSTALPPDQAYGDHPLPIGCDQTVSQPYVVAVMLQALELRERHRVLEIGTGSGYQTALLGELVGEVCTIECREELAVSATRTLDEIGYTNVFFHVGDGAAGWPHPERGFDAVIASAAPLTVPPALVEQLCIGGRLILPVGGLHQYLVHLRRTATGSERLPPELPVRFVPMRVA